MRIILFLFGITYFSLCLRAQTPPLESSPTMNHKQHQLFISWGYNRAYYNESDIHFKGEGFDFTLKNARAEDMPEEFSPEVYFNPGQFTVPQFNFRAGYYFGKNTAISMGWDHMKYHLIGTQLLKIDGHIDEEKYFNPVYTGNFNDEYILYNSSFMNYHHSDGFNFIRVALEQRIPFWQSVNKKHVLAMNASASIGAFLPWTDFTFFGTQHRNKPHLAGYGASLHAGFRYEFFRYFFLQGTAQFGWSNLVDIMLEDHLPSRAEQKITFIERAWAIGGYIPLQRKREDR
jgi:hypothetical protein